jgi:hypothetical protein
VKIAVNSPPTLSPVKNLAKTNKKVLVLMPENSTPTKYSSRVISLQRNYDEDLPAADHEGHHSKKQTAHDTPNLVGRNQ